MTDTEARRHARTLHKNIEENGRNYKEGKIDHATWLLRHKDATRALGEIASKVRLPLPGAEDE